MRTTPAAPQHAVTRVLEPSITAFSAAEIHVVGRLLDEDGSKFALCMRRVYMDDSSFCRLLYQWDRFQLLYWRAIMPSFQNTNRWEMRSLASIFNIYDQQGQEFLRDR